MRMNTIKPGKGSRQDAKRVGRGIGCGLGKTCGRGHKGQRSRTGGYHKTGFEGGQMPLQRRLPKVGFKSRVSADTAEVRLSELSKLEGDTVDLASLKQAGIVGQTIARARIFASGEVIRAFAVQGVHLTKGAREAIEKAGGKVVE
ncbi:MAG: 50S ribosomal protein L15 [Chromatiales bacterium]|nr:50S ribosomal protein L15 [Chromatiales bacterium]